jgi:3-keto-5-aminohexanoate cleavage enzyme
MEMPYVALTQIMGGHVRVGLEDNIYLERGVLAKSNAELVNRSVALVNLLGGEIASPSEAREILF